MTQEIDLDDEPEIDLTIELREPAVSAYFGAVREGLSIALGECCNADGSIDREAFEARAADVYDDWGAVKRFTIGYGDGAEVYIP